MPFLMQLGTGTRVSGQCRRKSWSSGKCATSLPGQAGHQHALQACASPACLAQYSLPRTGKRCGRFQKADQAIQGAEAAADQACLRLLEEPLRVSEGRIVVLKAELKRLASE